MIKKLSLAALVAMGSMSFANATPLTEAIKNVNFGGYLRLRVYNHSDVSDGYKNNRYRTTALFKFSVPVSEELKFNTAYAFDWNMYSDGSVTTTKDSNKDTTNVVAPAPGNVKFFLQYHKNALTALVGKIPVPTPVTATGVGEATAAGAIALYKVNDSVTVAAAGLDAMVGTDQVGTGGNNVYAAAALFKQNNIKAEAWYFNVNNILDSDIVLRADYKVNKSIKVHADFATAELDDKNVATAATLNKSITSLYTANALKVNKTQTYFNVSVAYSQDALYGKVGYAQTGKDGGVVTLDGDSPLASVLPTEQKTGITDTVDTTAIYAKVGDKLNKQTKVFAAASFINDSSTANKDYNEYMVGAKYAYTKKMNIYVYYSILDASGKATDDNNEARAEFKYKF